MFIAINRFRIARGSEEAFEQVWLNRNSQLNTVPGFVEFHLLKGPEAEDHTLYASHTVWQSKSAFEDWTKSKAFRVAHARAGNNTTGPLYLEHPKFRVSRSARRLRSPSRRLPDGHPSGHRTLPGELTCIASSSASFLSACARPRMPSR